MSIYYVSQNVALIDYFSMSNILICWKDDKKSLNRNGQLYEKMTEQKKQKSDVENFEIIGKIREGRTRK